MNYFSRIVMIHYVCGHKGLGIDTYQFFVTENKVKCPKCRKVSNQDTAEQIFKEDHFQGYGKAGGRSVIAAN